MCRFDIAAELRGWRYGVTHAALVSTIIHKYA
jgi:hypothetical protein